LESRGSSCTLRESLELSRSESRPVSPCRGIIPPISSPRHCEYAVSGIKKQNRGQTADRGEVKEEEEEEEEEEEGKNMIKAPRTFQSRARELCYFPGKGFIRRSEHGAGL